MTPHQTVFPAFAVLAVLAGPLYAQVGADSLRPVILAPVTVTATRVSWTEIAKPIERGDLHRSLEQTGVMLIRRGGFLTSDVYLDGFKRGDVEIVVDGERFPNACPNRMDPPLARVNPLQMASIGVDKSSTALQAGLGGRITYHRSDPGKKRTVRGGITGTAMGEQGYDMALALEGDWQQVTVNAVEGSPYLDGRGKDFADLYGYQSASFKYRLREITYRSSLKRLSFNFSTSWTDNVPFPYLQMDERFNRVVSGSVGYRGNKLYFNRTHHRMDNSLRAASRMMEMRSDANNLTWGVVGKHYDAYVRFWDGTYIHDLSDAAVTLGHEVRRGPVTIAARIGGKGTGMMHRARVNFDFVSPLFSESDYRGRVFTPAALSVGFNRLPVGIFAEVATQAPVPEQLFILVDKPAGKPDWVGNPRLRIPVKTGVRASWEQGALRAEAFATHVSRYVNLTMRRLDEARFITYENVDALLAGFDVRATWPLVQLSTAYTWAENRSNDTPLAEVAPLTGTLQLSTPEWRRMRLRLTSQAATAQTRVDEVLGETRTSAWYRLDASASYRLDKASLSLEVHNLTNAWYSTHLSYMRDPFMAGTRVYEPGRIARLALRFEL